MKAKKLLVISLAVICVIAVLLSCFFIFSVKDVKTSYSVSEGKDVSGIEQTLENYVGKNLLFLDLDDVKKDLAQYPYFEVVSIEKDFPNVINLTLKERREIYYFEKDSKTYLLDQTGFVLCEKDSTSFVPDSDHIKLDFNGITVNNISVGSIVSTDRDELVKTVFEMAVAVRLTDCINTVAIQYEPENVEAHFMTDTGVKINVWNPENLGKEKIVKAFEFYDGLDDYYKSFDEIVGFYNELEGVVDADWSDNVYGDDNV